MKLFLTKSTWESDDLDGQSVEFRILLGGETKHEVGEFLAVDCPDGFLSLSILVHLTVIAGSAWTQIRIPVPQTGVDRIELHPDQSVAKFRLFDI